MRAAPQSARDHHINTPHTSRFTIIGNHLTQHRRLSLTAIGLACHLQSLRSGTRVDIKSLAAHFPEGETRIAAALRELEAHGYLARIRERLPSGRIVTYTVSYNQPQPSRAGPAEAPSPPPPNDVPPPQSQQPEPEFEPTGEAAPETTPDTTAEAELAPTPPPAPKPPLPEPRTPDLDRHRTATALLASLHHHDPRLLLSERAVRQLAPAVAAWLERGAHPDAVRHTLTANLPREPLRHPAALLTHRLTELLPPLPPPPSTPPSGGGPAAPPPFHNCEGCERAIRTPHSGAYCRDCRNAGLDASAAA
ncbi:helix-turn-helix domain-containing protein [Streptomyces sp. NPDC042207]|uniref:helix-turn-helix domain-containing protein n=1 Tax=Streptomyces sp. NPDC042207 TaxID=3154331 RepID=UPI0033EA439E